MSQEFSFENLYKSYLNARKGKRDKNEVIEFELHALENVYDMAYELQNKTYKIQRYNVFRIYEPKERLIMAPPFRDRVMQRCLCDYILERRIEKHLIYDTYACRTEKGTHAALDRLEEFLKRYYTKYGTDGWFLKGDISKYFFSINHYILKKNLYPLLAEDDVYWLLEQIINSTLNPGLPLGNQSSQWFANFYMSCFDHYVKERLRSKLYVRYMDDWISIFRTKSEAKENLAKMKQYLWQSLRLKTNEKTQIFPIKNGVRFLGFYIYITETGKVIRKVDPQSIKRTKRKLKKFKILYREGKITKEEIDESYQSWLGHVQHGNCYRLVQKMNELYYDIFRE